MATVLMGPSQHVEEVSALSQICAFPRICDNAEYECPSISNCNAEGGDERGTAEHVDNTPSASKADKKDTTEVSCAPFYLFN
jgi:hypothetical protein